MIDIIWEKIKQILTSRLFPICLVFIGLISVLISRIFTLQIVEGGEHSTTLDVKLTRQREIKSTRGNILDRNGAVLAYNKISYAVVLEETTVTSNDELNAMLFRLINVLERYGNTIEIEFGIILNGNGELEFNVPENAGDQTKKNAEYRFKKNAYGLRSVNNLTEEQKSATAEEVFNYLRNGDKKYAMFRISEDYTLEEALKIMTLRYAIFTNYPKYLQIVICSDVSDETVAAIYENSASIPGVGIKQQSYRVYNDSIYNSHILGYTGLVNEGELENMAKDSGYNSSDYIGKLGIEKELEDQLAGTKGMETISISSSGKYLETLERTDPVAGQDVYLSIDSDLQKTYYNLIERSLAGILLSKINNSTDAGSRGTSAKNIKIPIYDVYFAILNNNVVDVRKFQDEEATGLEKQVYAKFETELRKAVSDLEKLLAYNSTTLNKSASEDMQDYLSYIYKQLSSQGVLMSAEIDTADSIYLDYHNNKISLSKFLQYAISKNWVDLSKIDIGDEYYSTEELYQKLLEYIKRFLTVDTAFHKKIYKELVYSYKLSGAEISLLLFDQGVLKYNEEDVSKLKNGSLSAYTFITSKIRSLDITPAQLALDPCSASVVVTDVNTGKVLAMVTYPGYETNLYANKIDYNYFKKVQEDLSEPAIHRAAKQSTAPGSTFKMITAVAALEEGVLGQTETVYDKVAFDKVDKAHPPKCWSSHGHGAVDITEALEVSCNYFFYEMGWRLGLDTSGISRAQAGLEKIADYASLFGFDRKSGIEIEEAVPKLSDKDNVRSAIGQGTNNYTPVQLSRYVTALATSGMLYDLTLIDKIVYKDKTTENVATKASIEGVKASTWDLVQEGMDKVGNGSKSSVSYVFKDFPYEVAGKTGTAQESKSRGNHALFVSYAPYKNPEISVTVVIPNGYSSSNAAELARNVYGYYFNVDGYDKLADGPAIMPDSNSVVSD
ncbi:hypothetical protein acsn021_26060 [Anaerocolumna cellulosilytica]|uniref:Uncharacterized protein n=1 Tax=Anaerocolumna cellulosilytica TaxID=433286 RepID=A0A6S6R4P7_9FIRM|nr:penicillin-binding transpeptidase domain-containing protein [Anaerocolumna cellulosilytica]MBB5193746.1 penicillin-binding protein 2 [Anaerocolumna cellulosilytica]BCJ95037.1 hypothetical protein acsn021_26060 [Anaerocolumna cellulosilytica]